MKKKIQVIIAGIIIVAGSFLYAHIGKNMTEQWIPANI